MIQLAVLLVLVLPLIGYYLDYRDRPQVFVGQLKNLGHGCITVMVGLLVVSVLLELLAKYAFGLMVFK